MSTKKRTSRKKEPQQEQAELVVMGAPTKFRPEYVDAIVRFFDVEPFYKEEIEQAVEFFQNGKPKKANIKYRLVPNKMPTLFSFARSIGVAYSTVWRWAERGEDEELQERVQRHIEGKEVLHPDEFAKIKALQDFCNAYKEAKELQKEYLINLGLSGATPPAAFIFVAKNVTDMKDEKNHLLTGADGGPIEVFVNELTDDELQDIARGGKAGAGT